MKLRVVVPTAGEGGFRAAVPALPGCVCEGENLEETLANVREAAAGWLEVAAERATAEVEAGHPSPRSISSTWSMSSMSSMSSIPSTSPPEITQP